MTLREYLVQRHWSVGLDSRKCLCPFHGDRSPSAYINDNDIWCFVCQRKYYRSDFQNTFGVKLDYVPEESQTLSVLQGKLSNVDNGKPYFTYPWRKYDTP